MTAGMSVLVVEDEEPVRELLASTLEGAGFTVVEAADAAQAQNIIGDNLPSMVLLDWMLPGMNGLEFTRWLKRDKALHSVPIMRRFGGLKQACTTTLPRRSPPVICWRASRP